MTKRDRRPTAEIFLRPRSVALIGASADVSKFGGRLLRNLLKRAFPGTVHVVHPKASELMGVRCVATLSEVSEPVDLVVVAVPRERVAEVVVQCPAVEARGVVVFTAGYAETGAAGQRLQGELVELARQRGLRLLGPNCLGLANAHAGVALSANEALDRDLTPGPVGLVSQSGALIGSVLDQGEDMGVHFAGFVNTGNEADLEASDFLEYFARDPEVKVLLAYLEGVKDLVKFSAALDALAAADKPVIVVKTGRTPRGQRAILSHTGALAGGALVFEALLRKKGAVAARDMDEALDMALLFTRARPPARPGIGMVSISGGLAGLAADRCEELGLAVPDFSSGTVSALREVLPDFATPQNPLDVTGAVTSSPGLLQKSLALVAEDEGVGVILLLLTMVYGRERLADEILRARDRRPRPFVAVWSGGRMVRPALEVLRDGGIPVYGGLGRALAAVKAFLERGRWRASAAEPLRCPLSVQQLSAARARLEAAGPGCLTEYESKQVLAELGFSVTRERLATDADQAAAFASELGFPVALKVMSPQIPHKSRQGALRLGLRSPEEVRLRARELLEACAEQVPGAEVHGLLVQEMVERAQEVIVGAVRDPGVGSVIMVGWGGPFVEAVRDVAFRIGPITPREAEEMVQELRGSRLLCEEGRPAASLVDVLVRISWLVSEADLVTELDVNLLVLTPSRTALVLDALINVGLPGETTRTP